MNEAPVNAHRGTKIHGLKAIAAYLGVTRQTILRWMSLTEDPLPVRRRGSNIWCWSGYLNEWAARRRGEGECVVGWLAICERLDGVHPRTARRWSRQAHDRLPVFRIGQHWVIYTSALRDWVHRRDEPVNIARVAAHLLSPAA